MVTSLNGLILSMRCAAQRVNTQIYLYFQSDVSSGLSTQRPSSVSNQATSPSLPRLTRPDAAACRLPIRQPRSTRLHSLPGHAERQWSTKPYLQLSSTYQLAVIANDFHIPFHDEKALLLFKMLLRRERPDWLILNGDF